jgi:hypothetical protein
LVTEVCGEDQSARTEVSNGDLGRGVFLKEPMPPASGSDEVLLHVPLDCLLYVGVTAPFAYTPAIATYGSALVDFMDSPDVPWSVKLATLLLWATLPNSKEVGANVP